MLGLSQAQRKQYAREGWCVVESLFSAAECDGLIDHMAAVHDGAAPMSRFAPPEPGEPHRESTDQVHLYDKTCFDFILHPKLESPLRDCLAEEGAVWDFEGGEPEGIKSHYWWTGSEWSQGYHTDGTALPGCMGVWIPLVDVDEEVGTLGLRPQSHNGLRIQHDDLRDGAFAGQRTHSGDPELRAKLTAQALAEHDALGAPPVHIKAPRGSAVFFSGHMQHCGVFGSDPTAPRQVIAAHYISSEYRRWPHVLWDRVAFDGTRRWSTGDEQTEAAAVNARLPRHPAMESDFAAVIPPSLLPCRRDAPLRVLSEQQRDEMDLRGFTILEDAFSADLLADLVAEIDALEAAASDG